MLLLLLLLESKKCGVRVVGLELDAVSSAAVGSVPIRSRRRGEEAVVLPQQVLRLLPLEALPPPQKAPVVKHISRLWVQGPVVALPRIPGLSWYLDEAVVERQVVPDGVLPGRELLPIIWEAIADEVADLTEGESFLRTLQDGHGD